MVVVESDTIRVTRSVVVPRSEIELRFSRSSGPGGQHAQKTETRVEASFDVEGSSALTEVQKRRVVARAGPVLRAVAQDERSQWRNRELATERLVEELREALRVPRRRKPTKPSAKARERRLEQKRRRGASQAPAETTNRLEVSNSPFRRSEVHPRGATPRETRLLATSRESAQHFRAKPRRRPGPSVASRHGSRAASPRHR